MSCIALVLALFSLGMLVEAGYRSKQHADAWLAQAGFFLVCGFAFCGVTLWVLIRDNRTGYPSFRCSLATLLWAFACVPVVCLAGALVRVLLR